MERSPLASPPSEPPEELSGWQRLNVAAPGVALVLLALGVMWVAEAVDALPGVNLDRYGIRPRSWRGLFGIVTAPFLHIGWGHLIRNSVPFVLLGSIIAWHSRQRFVEVTATVAVVSGLGVWIFGRSRTVHLGASGLVFGYVGYLVARGLFARRITWIVVGLVVAVTYSGLIWGLFPTARVSWLGHLFGALGGIFAAYVLHAVPDDDDDDGAGNGRRLPTS